MIKIWEYIFLWWYAKSDSSLVAFYPADLNKRLFFENSLSMQTNNRFDWQVSEHRVWNPMALAASPGTSSHAVIHKLNCSSDSSKYQAKISTLVRTLRNKVKSYKCRVHKVSAYQENTMGPWVTFGISILSLRFLSQLYLPLSKALQPRRTISKIEKSKKFKSKWKDFEEQKHGIK